MLFETGVLRHGNSDICHKRVSSQRLSNSLQLRSLLSENRCLLIDSFQAKFGGLHEFDSTLFCSFSHLPFLSSISLSFL